MSKCCGKYHHVVFIIVHVKATRKEKRRSCVCMARSVGINSFKSLSPGDLHREIHLVKKKLLRNKKSYKRLI